jgi:hypothetical protein
MLTVGRHSGRDGKLPWSTGEHLRSTVGTYERNKHTNGSPVSVKTGLPLAKKMKNLNISGNRDPEFGIPSFSLFKLFHFFFADGFRSSLRQQTLKPQAYLTTLRKVLYPTSSVITPLYAGMPFPSPAASYCLPFCLPSPCSCWSLLPSSATLPPPISISRS